MQQLTLREIDILNQGRQAPHPDPLPEDTLTWRTDAPPSPVTARAREVGKGAIGREREAKIGSSV